MANGKNGKKKNSKKNAQVLSGRATAAVTTPAASQDTVKTAYENVLLKSNPTATYTDAALLLKHVKAGKLTVLTDAQEKLGTTVRLRDDSKPVVTYTDANGAEVEIDLEKLFLNRQIQANNAGPREMMLGTAAKMAAAAKKALPQAKTQGKSGNAAKTGTKISGKGSDTEKVNAKAEKNAPSAGKVAAKHAGKKKSQAEYERLLIEGIVRLNSQDTLDNGGIKNIRTPKVTEDGTSWEVAEQSRLAWTFRSKTFEDVIIDVSVMDVQCSTAYLNRFERAEDHND